MGKNYRFMLKFPLGENVFMTFKTILKRGKHGTKTIRGTWRVGFRWDKEYRKRRLIRDLIRLALVCDGELVLRLVFLIQIVFRILEYLAGNFNSCTLAVGSIYKDCCNAYMKLLENAALICKRPSGVLQFV